MCCPDSEAIRLPSAGIYKTCITVSTCNVVYEKERSVQRFVWTEGKALVDYEMCVLNFGATCSPSLAQYVKKINAEKLAAIHPAAVNAITRDPYIDD